MEADEFVLDNRHQPDRIGLDHVADAQGSGEPPVQLIDLVEPERLLPEQLELEHDLAHLVQLAVGAAGGGPLPGGNRLEMRPSVPGLLGAATVPVVTIFFHVDK